MNNLLVKERDIVVPGQYLGEQFRCDNSCIREGDKTYSLVKGLVKVEQDSLNVIPLAGPYIPKVGDIIVGMIDVDFGGIYAVDVKSAFRCILKTPKNSDRGGGRGRDSRGPSRDSRWREDRGEPTKFEIGDLISAKIISVDESKESQLAGVEKLEPSYVIQVKPKRVPRIIGKKRSMIDLIRQYTRSRIIVGQNGLIWFKDGNIPLAVEAIKKVEAEAHTSGLTDRIVEFLRSRSTNRA
jgi:exosome complex component RRP4